MTSSFPPAFLTFAVDGYMNVELISIPRLLLYDYRLYKEQNMYRDEVEAQKLKLDKLVADGAEEWDVKNAVRDANRCPSRPFLRPGTLHECTVI